MKDIGEKAKSSTIQLRTWHKNGTFKVATLISKLELEAVPIKNFFQLIRMEVRCGATIDDNFNPSLILPAEFSLIIV
ncbi:hypothetical protein FCL47_17895 [Desulfopila sp. IMCC35006]|uniref:hypothetical protein n=1 Tax=Desulfopila sp. IMCC35006 TaxID=2569542 RepID=UPI0010ACFC4B|nr:hypothetical protein [Desulfopila sp. IMCC35006]TKB24702.1 hypothetical protein FCL47_17895 [Desulfopila sp. IMCC35006]